VAPFARKLAAVATHADRVIHLTADARTRTEAQLAKLGRIPPGIVAPIGVRVSAPAPLPPGLKPVAPWFVALGTIEPRKNIGLLLDVWERLAPTPQLYIIGSRGWADAGLLARLDALPPDGPVRVLSGLTDGAVATLLSGARALLFPSLAEGFGLPPLEAAALGTPVIAGDLAVTRELLGDYPVYLPLGDSYSWAETIARKTAEPPGEGVQGNGVGIPRWEDHFKIVLSVA
jgi:glycosyltransferase involved in cell wall biosynthesis